MDYCLNTSYIGNFAPGTTSSNASTKNIDCINLTASLISTNQLTIDGDPLTNYTNLVTNTQYLSTNTVTPNVTTVSGDLTSTGVVTTPSLSTQIIAHPTSTSTIQISNPTTLLYAPSSAFSGTLWSALCSNMNTNSSIVSAFGYNNSSSYNCWEQAFTYVGSTSTSNRLDFRAYGQPSAPTLSLIHGKIGVNKSSPTEALDVTGNVKASGTLAITGTLTSGAFTPSSFTQPIVGVSYSSATNNTKRTFTINGTPARIQFLFGKLYNTGGGTSDLPQMNINSSTQPTFVYGYTKGNNAGASKDWVLTTSQVPLWNAGWTSYYELTGDLELIRMIDTTGSKIWYAIRGNTTRSDITTPYWTTYYGMLQLNSGTTISTIEVTFNSAVGMSGTSNCSYIN
jgi:hypothetical protein